METPDVFKTHKLWHNITANTKIKKPDQNATFRWLFPRQWIAKNKKKEKKKHVSFAKMFSKITQNEGKFEISLSVTWLYELIDASLTDWVQQNFEP